MEERYDLVDEILSTIKEIHPERTRVFTKENNHGDRTELICEYDDNVKLSYSEEYNYFEVIGLSLSEQIYLIKHTDDRHSVLGGKNKKYHVRVNASVSYDVDVEALSANQAEDFAKEQFDALLAESIDYDDFVDIACEVHSCE